MKLIEISKKLEEVSNVWENFVYQWKIALWKSSVD